MLGLKCEDQKFDEKSMWSYLEDRTRCYKSMRIVFNPNTSFKDRLKETKKMCEEFSHFSESLSCLIMIFYLIPEIIEAKAHYQEIFFMYNQICKFFSKSDYFKFFTIQIARFLCKLPIKGELEYFHVTNLVLRHMREKKAHENEEYTDTPWDIEKTVTV
jgi:hypothetical protein